MLRYIVFFVCLLLYRTDVIAQSDTVNIQYVSELSLANPHIPQTAIIDSRNNYYLYVGTKSGGLIVVDKSTPKQMKQIYQLPVDSFQSLEVMNLVQKGDLLYIALGNFFGNNPQEAGCAIVDISNPAKPYVLDIWKNTKKGKGAASIAVQNQTIYLAAMTEGLIILEHQSGNKISKKGQIIPNPNWPKNNPSASEMPNARGLQVIGDIVYLCYDAGGLRIINVQDKTNPIETGKYKNSGVGNKQEAYNNLQVAHPYAYIGIDYCGLEIVDISDTSKIKQVSWWNPWGCEQTSNNWFNSGGHINQIEFDTVKKLVFMSAGASEVQIVSVVDPLKPYRIAEYNPVSNNQGAWGISMNQNNIVVTYINAIIPFFSNWSGIKWFDWNAIIKTAIEEKTYAELTIYPNPNHGNFIIKNESELIKSVHIYNTLGQQILYTSSVIANNQKQINLSEVSGIYYISIELSNGQTIVKKVLIQ